MNTINGFQKKIRKLRMIIQPLILSLPVVIGWHFMYISGLHSDSLKTDEPVVNAILPIIASFHAFLASFTLFREGMDISKIKTLIKRGVDDMGAKNEFLELVEDRVPDPLKYVLLSTGFIIQLWTATLYYISYWTGLFSVLSISYIIILIWEVIIDLDDPVHGIWIVRGIPLDWGKDAHIEKRRIDAFFDLIFGELESGRKANE